MNSVIETGRNCRKAEQYISCPLRKNIEEISGAPTWDLESTSDIISDSP